MLNFHGRYWSIVALRGLCNVGFSLTAFLWPDITLSGLAVFFGAYSVLNGVLALAAAMQHQDRRWPLALEGLAGMGAGAIALWPALTVLTLTQLVAGWAVVTGVLSVIMAVRLRQVMPGELLLGLAWLAPVVFGILLLIWPDAEVAELARLVSGYALVFGFLLITLALRLHSLRWRTPPLIPDIRQDSFAGKAPDAN